ncbi:MULTISPECIES: glycoside hydrolase family 16 protein [unclassified Allomuricauda]|uniref:glycoside hydrolase family 16 protein n=1 Tax=unclassified Allomuricauda TaxID=2615049 RepID=UPI001B10CC46|nr:MULTISPECIES: glycoside hydrolase family 16 protein [unclassified Allomuricauda]MBO6534199.1 glycoside hydrolase family 16 protein [Allomuricauda sp.]MBO6588508.1 glycoside hydrolase family 16 protein [Allomuricauda sp.]MBO6618352.1 glycoside hydrolase family 16 protein [Allomuricauda sp.]MBO6644046.1 glycoside hydrolase family 16 protein [Allomuricauda sp.]MBO6746930.1 glycoside hydrolase family 16 protein [Allomuricauda sp.]
MNTKHKHLQSSSHVFFKYTLLVFAIALLGCETDDQQTVARFTELTLSEEFDTDGQPNPSIWGYEIGTGENGWGNQELQYYTDRSDNVTVQNGVLLITAREESFEGSAYTSARLITKDKFEQRYGRFEARIRLPYGQGIWPAFWMLGADIDENPWPGAGEIDIMEYRGQEPTVLIGSMHGPGYSAGEAISKEYELTNDRFDTGFHIFGIEWGPEYVNFYVDDVLYNQITPEDVPGPWVFNKPFYILMNVAVGGTFVGSPDEETVFPQTMLVDYVRVYKELEIN